MTVPQQWTSAILRQNKFLQQIDPLDGTFTSDTGDYSPSALILLDFTWRLAGVRQEGEHLEWNIRAPAHGVRSSYRLRLAPTHIAEIRYQSGYGELFLNSKLLCRIGNVVRLVTSLAGAIESAFGVSPETTGVLLQHSPGFERKFSLEPNGSVNLKHGPRM